MKKIVSLLLVAMLALCMAVSCGGDMPLPDQGQGEGPVNPGGGETPEIPDDPSGMLTIEFN